MNARNYLERLQALAGVPIDIISTGPDREQTIVLQAPVRLTVLSGRTSPTAIDSRAACGKILTPNYREIPRAIGRARSYTAPMMQLADA